LSAGGETAGAHFLSTLSLCSLSVGVKDGVSFGWTHLAGLDSGGISLRHLAAFAGHDDWLEVGLVGWLVGSLGDGCGGLDVEVEDLVGYLLQKRAIRVQVFMSVETPLARTSM
jgi:hypothetical protein